MESKSQRDIDIEMTRKCFEAVNRSLATLQEKVLELAGEMVATMKRVDQLEGTLPKLDAALGKEK